MMRAISNLRPAMLLVFSVCVFAQEDPKKVEDVDPSGTWRWEYDMQGETVKDHAILQKQKEGKVTGWLHSTIRDKPLEVRKGKIKGDKLTFVVIAEFNGSEFDLEFAGRVKGDELTDGLVVVDTGNDIMEFPWAPKRSVTASDVIGQWDLVVPTEEREIRIKLVVKEKDQKLVGIHSSERLGDFEAKDLKIEDNQLSYRIAAEWDGNEMTAKLKGRPYGNHIKGTVDVELNGSEYKLPFTGKRKVEEKDAPQEGKAPAGQNAE